MQSLLLAVLITVSTASASTFMTLLPVGSPVGVVDAGDGFLVAGSRPGKCMLMKLDTTGATLWSAEHLFPGGVVESITGLPDGGFLLAGSRNQGGGVEAFVIKVDSEGQFD